MSDPTSDIYEEQHAHALYINVPKFNTDDFERRPSEAEPATSAQVTMSSFLWMGNFDYAKETDQSKGLLDVIWQAGPPGDPGRDDGYVPKKLMEGMSDVDPDDINVYFLDDVRVRDVDVDPSIAGDSVHGHGLTPAQRQRESARLYSRGGWRDHSDGNRITTTYGDKVEIVRGNYKMIVLGRQDDPGEGMGWDVGGSHLTDYAPGTMPGATYWHQWIPDYAFTDSEGVQRTGVWLLANTTENVYQFARNAGTFREEAWGDLMETYVGSENPPPTGSVATDSTHGTGGHGVDASAQLPGIKYDLPTSSKDGTPLWSNDNVDMIRSNPHIVEKTWARRIDSSTGSALCRVPEIHETTWATNTVEVVDVAEKIMSNTRAGSIFEATTAGAIFATTTAGTIWESTTSAVHGSLEVGQVIDIYAGVKLEMTAALSLTINAVAAEEINIGKNEIDIEAELLVLNNSITALNQTTTALKETSVALAKKHNSAVSKNNSLKIDTKALRIKLGI